MSGWIKLHRSFIEWEWFTTPKTAHLFLTILLRANYKETRWRGRVINAGQMVTGIPQLSLFSGLSEQSVRTSLKHLISTGELTRETTNSFSIITITNWQKYQEDASPANRRLTGDQQATNRQLTTSKKLRNIRKKEVKNNIYTRFATDLLQFWNQKNIIVHKESETLIDKLSKKILKLMKSGKTEEDIKQAINNYEIVLKSDDYYWNYKWALNDFLGRDGALKFYPDTFIADNYWCGANRNLRSPEAMQKAGLDILKSNDNTIMDLPF